MCGRRIFEKLSLKLMFRKSFNFREWSLMEGRWSIGGEVEYWCLFMWISWVVVFMFL